MSPNSPEYRIKRIEKDFSVADTSFSWEGIPGLTIDHYLWLDNGYRPRAEARLCYSPHYIYAYFKVFEGKIKVRFTQFQDPVYKDSCVEIFIDPFPEKCLGYINIETNAIGTMLIAFGPDRQSRAPISPEVAKDFEVTSSVRECLDGKHGAEFWTLTYKLPLAVFEKYYGDKIGPGCLAKGNFYKCGDETEFPHYGAWSPVLCAAPDFHRPEFFGNFRFL